MCALKSLIEPVDSVIGTRVMNCLHATVTVKVVALVPARFLAVTTYDPPSLVREMLARVSVDVAVDGLKPLFIIVTRPDPFTRFVLL